METNDTVYNQITEILKDYTIEDKLIFITNLLFDSYDELYKEDKLWNKLNLPNLKFKEDYNELEDTYNFHKENSYVYTVLDSAHDILLIANNINKNKRK